MFQVFTYYNAYRKPLVVLSRRDNRSIQRDLVKKDMKTAVDRWARRGIQLTEGMNINFYRMDDPDFLDKLYDYLASQFGESNFDLKYYDCKLHYLADKDY